MDEGHEACLYARDVEVLGERVEELLQPRWRGVESSWSSLMVRPGGGFQFTVEVTVDTDGYWHGVFRYADALASTVRVLGPGAGVRFRSPESPAVDPLLQAAYGALDLRPLLEEEERAEAEEQVRAEAQS